MSTAGKRNRTMNRSRVLRTIWRQSLVSRIETAHLLGLDKSTVSSLVNELIETGLIQEVAQGDASRQGGRRPVMLQINRDYGSVLGMELQPGFFRAALCDLHGRVIRSWSEKRGSEDIDFTEFLLGTIHSILDDLGDTRSSLMGIGVAMGGLVNSIGNEIAGSIPMGLSQYDFQREISDRVEVPVVAENDANACAWGELTFHRYEEVHDFLYVLVQMREAECGRHLYGGIGVGIGVVINGTLYPGANFTSGEFRSVFWDGQSSGQFSLTDDEAARVYTDEGLRKKFFRELAKNVALIINVMNLDHLFIGGDFLNSGAELEAILHEEIQQNWPYDSPVKCDIRFSSFGENAVVYGAAGMMLERLFSDQIFPLGDIRNRHGRDEVLSDFNEGILSRGGSGER